MHNIKISIIVPVYNSESYLRECIQSVIDQKFSNWELILIDDHSTDSSFEICKYYAENYSNINVYNNSSKGVSSARNSGICKAKGEYVVFLDSDDMLKKDALQILYSLILQADFGMCTYSNLLKDGSKKAHSIKPFTGSLKEFLSVIYGYIFDPVLQGPCWKIFKKEVVENNRIVFPESMNYGEDAFFVYDYLSHINSITIVNQEIYLYRMADYSLSHGFKSTKYYTNIFLNEKLQKICKLNCVDTTKDSNTYLRNTFANLINEAVSALTFREAIDEFIRASKEESVCQAYNHVKMTSLKKNVIKFCLVTRQFWLLYFLGCINNIILR